MSVYKKKGKRFYVYDFQFDGRRFSGSTRKESKRDAQAVERKKRFDAEQAGNASILKLAAGHYWYSTANAQSNARTTEYQIERILNFFGPETWLIDIDDSLVSDYVATTRARRTSRGYLSPASVNREVELLRRILNHAQRTRGAAIQSINWRHHKIKEAGPRDRVLSDDEEARLLKAAPEHLRDPIRLSLLTGLRQSNVRNLDWSQVDLRTGSMAFTLKGGTRHTLPITHAIRQLLLRQGVKKSGRVFLYRGQPITTWKTSWRKALKAAGIENFRWHDLRHTAASRMVRDNDIGEVREVLGHADIATTMRYAHYQEGAKRKVLESQSPALPPVNEKQGTDHK